MAINRPALYVDGDPRENTLIESARAGRLHRSDLAQSIHDLIAEVEGLGVNISGTWDAATNTPTLASGVGTVGDTYIVNVAGSTDLDGTNNWLLLDWAVFGTSSTWSRVPYGDVVVSFKSRKGDVVPADADYSNDQIVNNSNVAGARDDDALNTLDAKIDDLASDVVAVFAPAAYGGMRMSALTAFSNLGAAYQTIDVFDELTIATPRGFTFDLPNDTFTISEEGVFMFSASGSFDHNSSNSGRITNMRLYNVSEGVAGGSIRLGTGHNVEATPINAVIQFENPSSGVGDTFRLEIGGGDDYTSVDFSTLTIALWNIGEFRGTLP